MQDTIVLELTMEEAKLVLSAALDHGAANRIKARQAGARQAALLYAARAGSCDHIALTIDDAINS